LRLQQSGCDRCPIDPPRCLMVPAQFALHSAPAPEPSGWGLGRHRCRLRLLAGTRTAMVGSNYCDHRGATRSLMFCDRGAFRRGESGGLALAFAMAGAATGMVVLHRAASAMRLDTLVVLFVPKGESRQQAQVRRRRFAALSASAKLHSPENPRARQAHIASGSQHLRRLPD
jgi:hypothetical protein